MRQRCWQVVRLDAAAVVSTDRRAAGRRGDTPWMFSARQRREHGRSQTNRPVGDMASMALRRGLSLPAQLDHVEVTGNASVASSIASSIRRGMIFRTRSAKSVVISFRCDNYSRRFCLVQVDDAMHELTAAAFCLMSANPSLNSPLPPA